MKKEQFLKELEVLLGKIPDQEREEALQYYRDYFDDAGPENGAKVVEELGSPDKVAGTILEELGMTNDGFAKHKESENQLQPADRKKKTNGWKVAFLVLVGILLLPVTIPVGIAVFAVLAAIVLSVAGIAIGIAAAALALLICGIALAMIGIGKALFVPGVGLLLSGAGFLLLAVGILFVVVIVWCFGKFLPWLIRGIVALLRMPFRK